MKIIKICFIFSLLFIVLKANANWQTTSAPNHYYYDITTDGSSLYSSTYMNGVFKSTDGGVSWQSSNTGLNGDGLRCYQIIFSQGKLFLATVDGIYVSTNSGSAWVKKSSGLPIGGGANNIFAFSVFENSGVYFAGVNNGIFRSTDGAESWLPTNVNGSQVQVVSFGLYNNILFAGRNNLTYLYKSTDNGISWSPVTVNQFSFTVFCFLPDNNNLFIGVLGGIYFTTNSGNSWTSSSSGLGSDPYNFSIVKSGNTYITSSGVGGLSVYKSTSGGNNWVDASQGLPFTGEVDKLLIWNNKLFAAASNGIYVRNLSELDGVKNISTVVPSQFSLQQNYPNPFNPSTKIKFDIPSVGNGRDRSVQLKIYDVLGKEAATLVNEHLKPGVYEADWNAENFPSGVYFYKLESGSFTETKKMLLIK